jgi:pimeloyl-ACP methyl ester carboxylesterase
MSRSAEQLDVTTEDGRRLVVLDDGPTEALTLLVHMGTPNGLAAPLPAFLATAFSGLRRVFYVRPGYDGSTRQPGRSVADVVSDTTAILNALNVDSFVTIGWSGGGPHGLACSALLPERCLATTLIASPAPYTRAVELRDWYENDEDNELALAGDIDGFKERCDEFASQGAHVQAEDMPGWFSCAADKTAMTGEYAEWMAAYIRSACSSGGAGLCDDFVAIVHDWGFDLDNARGVTIWHGDLDQNVPLAHGRWLAERLPGAELRVVEGEGHPSVALGMVDIVDELLIRAGRVRYDRELSG